MSAPTSPLRIAFFAHERGDARVVKRISSLQSRSCEVIGFTFHRQRDKADVPPTWQNIALGVTYNRRYFQRLWALVSSSWILWKNREALKSCDVIYAINTDNAVLALMSRLMAEKKIPVAIELADIQSIMTASHPIASLLRCIERKVLDACGLLVTTSPGFVRNYFEPIQHYGGPIFLLENKVFPSHKLPLAIERNHPARDGLPWVVGCFGALRCRRSMVILHQLAESLGPKIHIILRGYPSGTIADDFNSLLGSLPNFQYLGPYQYPDDLANHYSEIDMNWAIDEADPSGNSAWLLPNRIYEGGCFEVPVLASDASETGAWTRSHGVGWIFQEPLERSLHDFFLALTPDEWRAIKRQYSSHSRHMFTGEADVEALVSRLNDLRTF